MPNERILRRNQRVFGDDAPEEQFGVIGSKAAGDPQKTKDIDAIQSLDGYLEGFFEITKDQGISKLPYAEDLNSLLYLITRQIAYKFQSGIPEWDSQTNYYNQKSFVQHDGIVYRSERGTDDAPNISNRPPSPSDDPESNVYWRKAFDEPEEEIDAFPLGYTYIQLPGTGDPSTLSMPGTWINISSYFKDRFMRIEGDTTQDFTTGGLQNEQTNNVHTVKIIPEGECTQSMSSIEIPEAGDSSCLASRMMNPIVRDLAHDHMLQFSKPGVDAQPANTTIRVWQRTV